MAIKLDNINGKNADGTIIVDLFADDLSVLPTDGTNIEGLTSADTIGFGSSIFTADKQLVFMKSDNSWEI